MLSGTITRYPGKRNILGSNYFSQERDIHKHTHDTSLINKISLSNPRNQAYTYAWLKIIYKQKEIL